MAVHVMHVKRVFRILKQFAITFFTLAQGLFGMFAFSDVACGAFVKHDLPCFISDGARVHGKPDLASVFPKRLVLEVPDHAVFFEQSFELFTACRIDIDLPRDVVTGSNQLFRRIESMYACEGRICDQVGAFGSRLKNTFTDVLEDPAILPLGNESGFFLPEQFSSLISRQFANFFRGVGRRLNTSPVSHTSTSRSKDQSRERPNTEDANFGSSVLCADLLQLGDAWEHGAIVPRPGTHTRIMARILILNSTLCNNRFPSQTVRRGCSNFESEISRASRRISCHELFGIASLSEWP